MDTNSQEPAEHNGGPLRVCCAQCGAEFIAEPRDAGKEVQCPECGQAVSLPQPEARSATLEPELGPTVPPPPPRKSGSGLRLKDEAKTPEPSPAPSGAVAGEVAAPPAAPRLTDADRLARSRLSAWLRPLAIVLIALVTIGIFEAMIVCVPSGSGMALHDASLWLREFAATAESKLHLLLVPRQEVRGVMTPFERFFLGIALLILAARLVARTRLVDVVYVRAERWADRTTSGLVFHFLALLVQIALLGWVTSLVRIPQASDGLVCGAIALFFLVSSAWLATLHLVAGREYPQITTRMVTNAVVGAIILLVMLWPEIIRLWTRAGATAVICLADTVLAVNLGASVTFGGSPRGWWHRAMLLTAGGVVVAFVAVLLACIR